MDIGTGMNGEKIGFKQAVGRGLRRHCPSCDAPTLFRGYLKVSPVCQNCGAANGEHRVDDIASYFTILLVGHVILAPVLALPFIWNMPGWAVMTTVLAVMTAATLAALPFVKGGVIGAISASGRTG